MGIEFLFRGWVAMDAEVSRYRYPNNHFMQGNL